MAGGDPAQFWSLTLKDVARLIAADGERRRHDMDLAYYTAWHAGFFSQTFPKGKFPAFDKFRPKKRKAAGSERQPWQEQKKFVQMLNALYGGDIKS